MDFYETFHYIRDIVFQILLNDGVNGIDRFQL